MKDNCEFQRRLSLLTNGIDKDQQYDLVLHALGREIVVRQVETSSQRTTIIIRDNDWLPWLFEEEVILKFPLQLREKDQSLPRDYVRWRAGEWRASPAHEQVRYFGKDWY